MKHSWRKHPLGEKRQQLCSFGAKLRLVTGSCLRFQLAVTKEMSETLAPMPAPWRRQTQMQIFIAATTDLPRGALPAFWSLVGGAEGSEGKRTA